MQSNFITQLLDLKGVKVTKISHEDSFVKIYITTDPKEHICPACGAKLKKFMTTENRQLRIYLFNLNIPILYLEKEGMLALVEKGFMSLMTFYLVIIA